MLNQQPSLPARPNTDGTDTAKSGAPASTVAAIYKRESSDPRVIVADGRTVQLRVERGHLSIQDGIGQHRRTRTLPRVERTVRRIVVLADNGYISWDAARWCADVGITVLQCDRSGRQITVVAAPEPDDARLRRAQAFASEGGPHAPVGLDIVKYVLAPKIGGQAAIAAEYLNNPDTTAAIAGQAALAAGSNTVEFARGCEAVAASAYWKAWTGRVIVPFDPREAFTVPAHWTTFTTRSSPICRSKDNGRDAADPINALLNYAYRIAEIECRLACLTHGLDPAMGFLHYDEQNRDSLALDLLEILRPDIDRFVLDLLCINDSMRYLTPKLFTEARDGGCRLVAPLTHRICEQAPTWAYAINPHAKHIAGMLAKLGKGEIRPAPHATDHAMTTGPKRKPAKPLRLSGTITPERIIPDNLWNIVAPALPANRQHSRGGRPFADNRAVLAGITCVELLGCSWAKIPPTLGVSRYTCSTRLDQWRTDGAWTAVQRLLDNSEHITQLRTEAADLLR